MNPPCPKCGGILRTIEIILADGESCQGSSCYRCGYYADPTVLENRTPERREFWRLKVEQEEENISELERILREYDPAALWNY